jgi:hypothetical protein
VLLGGLLAQVRIKPKRLSKVILHSTWLALVAAIAMVGINQFMHGKVPTIKQLDHTQIAAKSPIISIISTLGYLNIRRDSISNKSWVAMTLLTISNISTAIYW